MQFTKIAGLGLALAAGIAASAALAKGERSQPEAKARAEIMSDIGRYTKVLGDMAGGKAEFDASAAAAAKAGLAEAAASMPTVFETEGAADPASDAKTEIWSNWDDFVAKADVLKVAAEGMDTASVEGIKAGMGAVGGTCRACHTPYRN